MIELYTAPTPNGHKVSCTLEALGMDYKAILVNLSEGEQKKPDFLKISPNGRIPAIVDTSNNLSIFESGAIIQYILDKYGNGRLKPDINSDEYPYYLQWFHFCEGMVMPPMNQIVVQTVLLPPDRRDETVLNQAKNLLSKSLSPVNDFLDDKDYLIGEFSAADCMLGHSCYMANRLGCVSDEMTNVKKYVSNIEAREAFQKAIKLGDEAGNPIG